MTWVNNETTNAAWQVVEDDGYVTLGTETYDMAGIAYNSMGSYDWKVAETEELMAGLWSSQTVDTAWQTV